MLSPVISLSIARVRGYLWFYPGTEGDKAFLASLPEKAAEPERDPGSSVTPDHDLFFSYTLCPA